MEINSTTPSNAITSLSSAPKQANNQSFASIMHNQLAAKPETSQLSTNVSSTTNIANTSAPSDTTYQAEQTQITKQNSASMEFQEYMSKNDAEKIRLAMLKEMGLTEEEFEQLPPEAQLAIEQKIMERLKQQNGVSQTGFNTEVITPLLNV